MHLLWFFDIYTLFNEVRKPLLRRNSMYGVYHYMCGNISTTFDDGYPLRSKSDAPVFEGTREQCYNWLKSQFIDAATSLADIDAKVMIDLDDDLRLYIVIRKDCGYRRYYYRSLYHVTEM